jgi:hypothetical protein
VSDSSRDTDERVVELSARLDSLVAAWEQSISALRAIRPAATSAERRTPAEVLTELEDALRDLELRSDEHRRIADAEAAKADDWEQKAMMSIRDGRDGLARQALLKQQEFFASATAATNEAAALEAVRDAYRNAVLAVRATLPDSVTQ